MTRLTSILLLIFCSSRSIAQQPSSNIRIRIIIEAGVNTAFSYADNDSSYDMNVFRIPKKAKDTLIQQNIFTSHPLLFFCAGHKPTPVAVFPGDNVTIRFTKQGTTINKSNAAEPANTLLFFKHLNDAGNDMELYFNTTAGPAFKRVTAYTDELDSLIQLAYKRQLAFLNSYEQKHSVSDEQKQYLQHVLYYNMIFNRLLPYYNDRFKNMPLSQSYLQSIAALKSDFTNPSLMSIFEFRLALFHYNRYLCKSVANPPSGDAMKDANYNSALQQFPGPTADYLLYYLMRASAVSSKEWFLKNTDRFNNDCHNPVLKTIINNIQKDVALAVKTGSNSMNLQDVNGKVVPLKDLLARAGDSIVYVDFWAGWCAPCLAEMPHSVKLQQHYKNKKIAFLYFSLDNTRTEWLKSMKNQAQMNGSNSYFVVNGANSALSKWVNLNSIPRYIVYDKNKKLSQNDAPRPSDAQVQSLLNQLLKN